MFNDVEMLNVVDIVVVIYNFYGVCLFCFVGEIDINIICIILVGLVGWNVVIYIILDDYIFGKEV